MNYSHILPTLRLGFLLKFAPAPYEQWRIMKLIPRSEALPYAVPVAKLLSSGMHICHGLLRHKQLPMAYSLDNYLSHLRLACNHLVCCLIRNDAHLPTDRTKLVCSFGSSAFRSGTQSYRGNFADACIATVPSNCLFDTSTISMSSACPNSASQPIS